MDFGARLLVALIAAGAEVEVQQPKADPTRTDQTVLDATIKLKDIDVGQLLDKLQVKVPYKIGGRVSVSVAVAVPLGQAATRAAYRQRLRFTRRPRAAPSGSLPRT